MRNKYKRLLKNSIWTLAGNSGSKLLGFFLLPLYTKWLGTYGFGLSDLITTYSSFLISIMTMSVSEAIFVFTKNANDKDKKVFYSSSLYFIGIILSIWCVIFYLIQKATNVNNIHNSFTDNIWFIYGIVLTSFLQQYVQQFVISLEKIKIYSFTGLILTICTFLFSLVLIPTYGVKGYIGSIISANIITMLYSFVFSQSYKYFNIHSFDYKKICSLLRYSIPLIPNSIIWWLVSALNRPVMEYYLDYSSIGIYAIANRFPAIINMLFAIFSVSWNISVFEEYNKKGYEQFYINVFKLLFLIITTFAILFNVFSETIINLFTTKDFNTAYLYMPFLIIASFLSCVSSFLGTNFSVVKQSKYFLYSSIWGAITAVIFNLLLIPQFGLWGATISTIMSFGVMTLARYKYSLKIMKVQLGQSILLYFIAISIMSICTILFSNIIIKLFIAIGIIVTLFVIQNKSILLLTKYRLSAFDENERNHY